jgi:hypothetical protein
MPILTEALGALENANSAWRIQVLIQQEVSASAPYKESITFLERVRDAYACLRVAEL